MTMPGNWVRVRPGVIEVAFHMRWFSGVDVQDGRDFADLGFLGSCLLGDDGLTLESNPETAGGAAQLG